MARSIFEADKAATAALLDCARVRHAADRKRNLWGIGGAVAGALVSLLDSIEPDAARDAARAFLAISLRRTGRAAQVVEAIDAALESERVADAILSTGGKS